MSRVAEILMEEARMRGQGLRDQGAIIGQGVAQAAEVPLQLQQVQRQQQADAMKQAIQQQDLQLGQERLNTFADARRDEELTKAVVKKNTTMNPTTGHLEPNQASIMAELSQQSPRAAAAYATLGEKVEAFNFDMQQHHIKGQQQQIDHARDILGGILQLPEADQPAAFNTYRGTLAGYAPDHPLLGNLPQTADSVTIKRLHDGLLSDSERLGTAFKESETKKNLAEEKKQLAEAAKLDAERAQGPKLGTPEEQYLRAVTSGDTAGAQRVLTSIQETARAKQDPTEKALRESEIKKNLAEAAKLARAEQAPDVGVQTDTRTTATGRQWADLSKYKGKEYTAAQQQARAQGIYGASKEEADALQNIDVARQNMALIAQHLDKLPSGAGSRLLTGPANKLQAYLQTDEDLAAWGTWRTAAIQAMRALAGSKGLRINRSEIEASTENDIPKITDTIGTAKEKLDRVRKMLTSQENGMMGTPSGSTTTPPPSSSGPLFSYEDYLRTRTK